MPIFAFNGIDATGKPTKGVREADSPKALRGVLRREGIFVSDVKEDRSGAGITKGKGLSREFSWNNLLGPARVTRKDLSLMTRQLATLLRAGITLSESLAALFDQTDHRALKSIIGDVKTRVNEGSTLADALSNQKQARALAGRGLAVIMQIIVRKAKGEDPFTEKVFSELYINMVRAGETAGNLEQVLARLADFMEADLKLRSKVQAAMVYPIIMAVVGVAIVAILMIAVIPKITEIFADNEQSLPWNTEFLIWSSHLVGKWYWLITLLALVGVVAFAAWSSKPEGKRKWHAFVLKLPLVGNLVRMVVVARFTRTLGTMLASGVNLLKSLDIAKDILGNVVLVEAVEKAREAIKEGESIAVTLKKSGHFPPIVTHMIAVGEKAGQLEVMLETIAINYEDEVDASLTRLTSMLEPLMLVLMGGAIAFVVFSILMPIMDMQSLATQ